MNRPHSTLTNARASPIFNQAGTNRNSNPDGPPTALVSLTVTRAAVVFTDVRCRCGRVIMLVPGTITATVAPLHSMDRATGSGRVVWCKRCRALNEVTER